ncbi:MAG: zinc-ribbon domain-containing protein [Candidatus Hadarchaeum sp.]|uniref:zinc-ribbon domain-containing protein n=1 Tax=Candidatus Hadarchaeum sp. TaxID=2883567 RepID=UPI003D11AE3E
MIGIETKDSSALSKIKIYPEAPALPFDVIGPVQARVHAATALSPEPTLDEVNQKLREKALKMGANAVINVEYKRQKLTLTAWKVLTAKGQAVIIKEGEKKPEAALILAICPECHERIPLDSKFCPECGTRLKPKK